MAAPSGPALSVVLVDALAGERSRYAHAFRADGYRAFEFSEAESALSFSIVTHPALIVTDAALGRPGQGIVLVRRLKLDPSTKDIPVILVGADAPAAETGCDLVLPKPCEPGVLVTEAREVLARSRRLFQSSNRIAPRAVKAIAKAERPAARRGEIDEEIRRRKE